MTERELLPETDEHDLEQFKVAGTALIINTLTQLVKRREPVLAFLPGANNAFSSGSVVNVTDEYVEIEFSSNEISSIDSGDYPDLDFVSLLNGVKTQFQAKVVHVNRAGQLSFVQCALPDVAYRIQRRGAYRVRPVPGTQPEIVVRTEPGNEISYEILDLSATGVSFVLHGGPLKPQPGDVFEHTRLELGPRVPIPCTVVVQSVREVTHPETKERVNRVGAEFANLPNDVARMIQISVQDAERAFLRFSR